MNRRGFSIVEVVIALSTVVIVTVTALSIALSSVAAKVNAINESRAQGFAANVLECFKAAENEDDFADLVSFAEDITLTKASSDENGSIYTHTSEKHKFTAEISVKYPQNDRPKISVTVEDKNGDTILSFEYERGA